jgi:cob(I)alamin adenosyltransferase
MMAASKKPRTFPERSGFFFAAEGTTMQFHLYFGEGKGKTTAALGQALRSHGQGWRVLFVQFLKDAGAPSGEVAAVAAAGKGWRLLRSRLPAPVLRRPGPADREKLRVATEALLKKALGEAQRGKYEVVVLDEALAAWKLGLLKVSRIRDARRLLAASGVRLFVVTGRWAPKSLLSQADLVTEMRKVRHPFDRGERAKDGIDF